MKSSPTNRPTFRWAVSLVCLLLAAGVVLTSIVGCESGGGGSSQIPSAQTGSLQAPGRSAASSAMPGTAAAPLVPPTSLPPRADEIWVIEKRGDVEQARAEEQRAASSESVPGMGGLLASRGEQLVAMPLERTSVDASIAGYMASVSVKQSYKNPFDTKIEAIYVFPLPENAAVNEFLLTIGERTIRGIIRERGEAERVYQEAKSQGYVASLLTQERPNVFTQKVANIEPGKQIDVTMKYFHTLAYDDGAYEFVFPMVVGPRFNPPGAVDPIAAAPRGPPTLGGKSVQYLAPGESTAHRVDLAIALDAGVSLESVESVNHKVAIDRDAEHPSRATIKVNGDDALPNKDFVLRYKVAGQTVKAAMMRQPDPDGSGGTFVLMMIPPASDETLAKRPVELVFTLDVSGSMSGKPSEQSRRAIETALAKMNEADTFNIVKFAQQASSMHDVPVPATKENLRAAKRFLDQANAGGGTMMLEGLRRALTMSRADDDSAERVRFAPILTDGFIGNEQEIFQAVHQLRGGAHVFSFGVGSSTNRYLLDGLARIGAGTVAYLPLDADSEPVMSSFFDRIRRPAMTDIELAFDGATIRDVYPERLPVLFVGRPLVISGRYEGDASGAVVVRGRMGSDDVSRRFELSEAETHEGVRMVWARAKIGNLHDQHARNPSGMDLAGAVKQTALEYGLLSEFTAFVAVDSSTRTAGESGVTVMQPVPVPEGVKYETTVR